MSEQHHCDERPDAARTQVRVLRLVRAILAGHNLDEAATILNEFDGCPRCSRRALSISTGNTVAALGEPVRDRADQLMDIEMRIAALETKLKVGDK